MSSRERPAALSTVRTNRGQGGLGKLTCPGNGHWSGRLGPPAFRSRRVAPVGSATAFGEPPHPAPRFRLSSAVA